MDIHCSLGVYKGEIIVSDPRKGIVNLKVNELFKYINSEEEVNLLYLEKNSNTPKARFGLGWFVPSIRNIKTL